MSVINPCYECKKRTEDCHSTCEWYSKWKNFMEEMKKVIYDQKQADSLYKNYVTENRLTQQKRKHLEK